MSISMKKVIIIKPTFKLPEIQHEPNKNIPNNLYSLNNVRIKNTTKKFKTTFQFLNCHGGLQAGHLHLLLGRTNKGKSTLILSLILENIINGHKVLLFLSEGLKSDVKKVIEAYLSTRYKEQSTIKETIDRLLVVKDSDLDTPNETLNARLWINSLFKIVKEQQVEIVYFDNFSTCSFSDSSPEIQAQFIRSLNSITENLEIPVFGSVHPAKTVSPKKELVLDDIRANSAFINIPSNIYALNDFSNIDNNTRIIKILKLRRYGDLVGKYFQLAFKKINHEGIYIKDTVLDLKNTNPLFLDNKLIKKQV